jgi:glutathionyl-hydroquinone reductase
MGIVVDGQWRDEELSAETDLSGAFKRAESQFRDWITAIREQMTESCCTPP